ncbi:MAG: glycoside hydrolase family 65 protein [bacterium]|nr:glycoside hydrolase family 65 protein [bacterium]
MQHRLWDVTELTFEPNRQLHYETLFTIGNGYLGTRGAFEEGFPGDTPATLIHGIYNHAEGALVPELVNAPNWLPIRITVDGTPLRMIMNVSAAEFMNPPDGLAIGYERALYLDRGLLRREVLFRAASGNIVRIVFERFASLHDQHVMAQRVTVTAVDGDPQITVEAALDADVRNGKWQHWQPQPLIKASGTHMGVQVTTNQSGYRVGMSSLLITALPAQAKTEGLRASTAVTFTLKQEESVTLDKLTAIYTSRDVNDPLATAEAKVEQAAAAGYEALLRQHEAEWAVYWQTADIQIDGDEEIQRAVRFTTYHILIPTPRHDERASVGAKTLSGLGYKGHVFWDTEIFIVPALVLINPKLARNLLMYRYHNLQGARNKAKANGFEGAMFPWESTDTGEETTPQWSDPQPDGSRIRIWTGDNEQHISTDIAYAIMQYWRWTGDDAFMRQYGAEIILDTAVFWGSRVEYKAEGDRYEISQQIGPDEYHENIDNSVFVNRMTQWHLQTAIGVMGWLATSDTAQFQRLIETLNITPERQAHWRDVIAKLYIPFDADKAIHIQFPGFFEMEYIPVPTYTPRTTSVQAILGHARSIQTQVIKQADVVMMMALLGDQLSVPPGYDVRQVMLNNWHTYYPRTDHGSSLSPAMHAWVAAKLGLDAEAYHMLHHAAHIDLQDNKGNVRDGMHAAACGGVWQALIFGLCGLHIGADGQLATAPNLPEHWRQVSFKVYYRGEVRAFTVTNP